MTLTRTTCPYCGVGCGLQVHADATGAVRVQGDPEHPANRGLACGKGLALADTLSLSDRLLHPHIDGQQVTWDSAITRIADEFRHTLQEHGPESVAFYVSGQLLSEDYYVANKFVKGWLGSANIDSNSRLCMASAVAGHKRAFASDTVPGCYDDLEHADCVVLVGSNLSWCHPVLQQRLLRARELNPRLRIVVVDPRRTATAEQADVHLAIRHDSDQSLFAGLLHHLHVHDALDEAYCRRHVAGLSEALRAAGSMDVTAVAACTGLGAHDIERFYTLWRCHQRVVTVFSQGVNQGSSATDTVNSILNVHLATGRIGKPGAGPFSVTGQPNAMGGREIGALSNLLAGHMALEDADDRATVQSFWKSPQMPASPGLKAVELFDAVHEGRIRALWILATNPVDSLPDADRVREALVRCPFVVVSDVSAHTDTLQYATVRLPAHAWGEKDGTVTNSERCISRQRRFRTPPPDTRPDWWAISRVAQQFGSHAAFDYHTPAEIFREHARLSGYRNNGERLFDISGCSETSTEHYNVMQPFYWPYTKQHHEQHGNAPTLPLRFFSRGNFPSHDRRARMLPAEPRQQHHRSAPKGLTLNTGRIRDQWHTMTRTGHSARLSTHLAEPFVEIHPHDAACRNIDAATIVSLQTSQGKIMARALITDRVMPGNVFVPMHWSDQWARDARVNTLPTRTCDPVSGQPASKSATVQVRSANARSYAYVLMSAEQGFPHTSGLSKDIVHAATTPVSDGWQIELAAMSSPAALLAELSEWLDHRHGGSAQVVLDDHGAERHQRAWFQHAQLSQTALVTAGPASASRSWLRAQFQSHNGSEQPLTTRHQILAARPADPNAQAGATICSCVGVGALQILRCARRSPNISVVGIGEQLGAGTQCGSCRGEITALLNSCTGVLVGSVPDRTQLPSSTGNALVDR